MRGVVGQRDFIRFHRQQGRVAAVIAGAAGAAQEQARRAHGVELGDVDMRGQGIDAQRSGRRTAGNGDTRRADVHQRTTAAFSRGELENGIQAQPASGGDGKQARVLRPARARGKEIRGAGKGHFGTLQHLVAGQYLEPAP